jgi:N-acetylglucosaminyldiphosphoundecaprenol N-acetyl-beta-D-mannosaminyltransferase
MAEIMDGSRIDILGIGVDPLTVDAAVDVIGTWVARRQPNYVCVTGVHGVVASQDDPELRRVYDEAGLVTADGMPLVWLSRRRGHPGAERVYGPDLMLATFARSEVDGWRHYLYGTTPATLARLEANLAARFPRAVVAGRCSPPFRPLTRSEEHDVARRVERARADIVWVGLGAPKQERWMAAHVGRLAAPVLVGVGAAFDIHAGVTPQAPPWMRRSGLEWAFRLAVDPRRLAGRYLRDNPRFVWLLLEEALASDGREGSRGLHSV